MDLYGANKINIAKRTFIKCVGIICTGIVLNIYIKPKKIHYILMRILNYHLI